MSKLKLNLCFFSDAEVLKMKMVLESLASSNDEKVQCDVIVSTAAEQPL